MKKSRVAGIFTAIAIFFSATVASFADEIYEPEVRPRTAGGALLLLVICGVLLVSGLALFFILRAAKKKKSK